MIAAASPRFSVSDTPDSTVSGPPGAGYCFVTAEISSMDARAGDAAIDFEHPRRHLGDAVVLADTLRSAPSHLSGQIAILPQTQDSRRKGRRIVGLDENAPAGAAQHLGKRAAPGLHHRHSAGHRFE